MAKSKSDISNSAVRILLQEVGRSYDAIRGKESFKPSPSQKDELLGAFNNECCYCGKPLSRKTLNQDHLIPENRKSLGLHAWGNVVPCCKACNDEKHHRDWKAFLHEKYAGDSAECARRREAIENFRKQWKYDPSFDLRSIADTLYEDMGKIAMERIILGVAAVKETMGKIVS